MLSDLFTPRRASFVLGIRPSRIEQLARTGELNAILVDGEIRITESDLAEFIRTRPRASVPEPLR
jgi:hypothetical protein